MNLCVTSKPIYLYQPNELLLQRLKKQTSRLISVPIKSPSNPPFIPILSALVLELEAHMEREKIRLCLILSWWCGVAMVGLLVVDKMCLLSVPLIHSTHHKERINEEENGILSNERASQNGTKNRSRRKAVSHHRMYSIQ